jgi:alpha-amylase
MDYVANLGVDAIWMSPFIENTENGYHGYWAKDLYKVNEKFGTEAGTLLRFKWLT